MVDKLQRNRNSLKKSSLIVSLQLLPWFPFCLVSLIFSLCATGSEVDCLERIKLRAYCIYENTVL